MYRIHQRKIRISLGDICDEQQTDGQTYKQTDKLKFQSCMESRDHMTDHMIDLEAFSRGLARIYFTWKTQFATKLAF